MDAPPSAETGTAPPRSLPRSFAPSLLPAAKTKVLCSSRKRAGMQNGAQRRGAMCGERKRAVTSWVQEGVGASLRARARASFRVRALPSVVAPLGFCWAACREGTCSPLAAPPRAVSPLPPVCLRHAINRAFVTNRSVQQTCGGADVWGQGVRPGNANRAVWSSSPTLRVLQPPFQPHWRACPSPNPPSDSRG